MGFLKFFDKPQTTEEHVSFDLMTQPANLGAARIQPHRRRVPASTPPIPTEIVLNILEAAYYTNDHISSDTTHTIDTDYRQNRAFLRNCALVCRAWRLPAQKLLFRSVTISSQRDYYSFKRAISSSNGVVGDELRRGVVSLSLTLDPNQPGGLLQPSFARAVCACPNLYDLTVSLYGVSGGAAGNPRDGETSLRLDPVVLDLLKKGAPTISALHVNNWSSNGLCTTELLGIWSDLKTVSIGGVAPQLPTTTPPTSITPFSPSLSSLRTNFQSQPSYAFFKWVLGNSSDSLRSLDFEREVPAPLFTFLLETYGAGLESLSMPSCGTNEYANAIKQYCVTSLRELRTEGPASSPVLHKWLAESHKMEHLAFGMNANTTMQPILEIIRKKENTKAVTVLLWEGGESHSQIAALKMACACRGVELRFVRNVRAFRELVRGDPVPSASYPQSCSLANLNYMLCESTALF